MASGFVQSIKRDEKLNSGEIKGKLTVLDVACLSWFTRSGKVLPIAVKYQGDDGQIYEAKHIKIKTVSDKFYCGIASVEYICEAKFSGLLKEFKLIYYLEEHKWKMMV